MGKYGAGKNQKSDAGMTLIDATYSWENSKSRTLQSQQQPTKGNPSDDEGMKGTIL